MNDWQNKDYAADLFALKAVNDQLREQGQQWLWQTLETLCAELNQALAAEPPLQLGRQFWRFNAGGAVLVGERFGVRYRQQTLLIESGWPREPQHGYVTGGGLARARVSVSQNVMLEPRPMAELLLKRQNSEIAWHTFTNNQPGEVITAAGLRHYLNLILKD